MNAPMRPAQAGMVPVPQSAQAPAQAPQQSGYPGGYEVMQQQSPMPQAGGDQVENPVIAGLRSVVMLVGEMVKKGDPRGQQAAQHLQALIGSLSGQDMSPPTPGPTQGPPPAPGATPPVGTGAPAPMPPAGGQAPMSPEPEQGPELVSEFDEGAPAAPTAPRPAPMQKQGMTKPGQNKKQPVVLT